MSQEGLAVFHESLPSRSKNRCDLIEQVFGRREQLELQTEISTLPHDSHVELSDPPLFVQRGRCIVEPGVVEIATKEIRELPSTPFFVLEFCLLPFVLDRLFSFVVEFGPCPSVPFLEPEQLRDFGSKRIVPPRNERTSMDQVREIIARSPHAIAVVQETASSREDAFELAMNRLVDRDAILLPLPAPIGLPLGEQDAGQSDQAGDNPTGYEFDGVGHAWRTA